MKQHNNTAAWVIINIAALAHILTAALACHAAATGHSSPLNATLLGGPSIVALTAALLTTSLCKAAAKPLPSPNNA
uniref:Uncharacterized protein n=1 Tax=Siphoviridae sp. ctpyK9 TaxID=2825679 RepID=A0A8S5UU52_9CAUD|nr:MAG TPA: hypothetical protein [Siphoviridae sp. ctpyK9]